jgi:hypothetical protein
MNFDTITTSTITTSTTTTVSLRPPQRSQSFSETPPWFSSHLARSETPHRFSSRRGRSRTPPRSSSRQERSRTPPRSSSRRERSRTPPRSSFRRERSRTLPLQRVIRNHMQQRSDAPFVMRYTEDRRPLGVSPGDFAYTQQDLTSKLRQKGNGAKTVVVDVANLFDGEHITTQSFPKLANKILDAFETLSNEDLCVLVFRNFLHGYLQDNGVLLGLIEQVFSSLSYSQRDRLTCLSASSENVRNCDDVLCLVTMANLSTYPEPAILYSNDRMNKEEDFSAVKKHVTREGILPKIAVDSVACHGNTLVITHNTPGFVLPQFGILLD